MADTTKTSKGFSADEKAAMRERAKELKAESRSKADRADGERDLLAKIAEMPPADRDMAERLHKLITAPCPAPDAEDLVRHARLCQGRQARVLLQGRVEVRIRGTRRSASRKRPAWTTARCGRRRTR